MKAGTTAEVTFQPAWPDGGVFGPTMNAKAAAKLLGYKNEKVRGKKNMFRCFKITTVTTVEEVSMEQLLSEQS